jgi:hypothetical protein
MQQLYVTVLADRMSTPDAALGPQDHHAAFKAKPLLQACPCPCALKLSAQCKKLRAIAGIMQRCTSITSRRLWQLTAAPMHTGTPTTSHKPRYLAHAALPTSRCPSDPNQDKGRLVSDLLAAKRACGLTFTQIASKLGLSNVYTAQLFYMQVWLVAAGLGLLRAVRWCPNANMWGPHACGTMMCMLPQAQLPHALADKLRALVPALTPDQLHLMQEAPSRR